MLLEGKLKKGKENDSEENVKRENERSANEKKKLNVSGKKGNSESVSVRGSVKENARGNEKSGKDEKWKDVKWNENV